MNKLSAYCKEELPTWEEVYKEFYLNQLFMYDPTLKEHNIPDPYWKLPHRKLLICWVCNQFNKMLFEDGYRELFIKWLNEVLWNRETEKGGLPKGMPTDVRFTVMPIEPSLDGTFHTQEMTDFINCHYVGLSNCPPPVYKAQLPTGAKNPFEISTLRRIDIALIDTEIILTPIVKANYDNSGTHSSVYLITPFGEAREYKAMIDFMIQPYKEYFEDGVGWKDEDGNVLPSDRNNHCQGVGHDPAL